MVAMDFQCALHTDTQVLGDIQVVADLVDLAGMEAGTVKEMKCVLTLHLAFFVTL